MNALEEYSIVIDQAEIIAQDLNSNFIDTSHFIMIVFKMCDRYQKHFDYDEYFDEYINVIGEGLYEKTNIKTTLYKKLLNESNSVDEFMNNLIFEEKEGTGYSILNHLYPTEKIENYLMAITGDYSQIEIELPQYLTNLNEKEYITNPAIGRDIIIEDIEKTLLKMNKPNILLIGEPGVGKTAIVEGLAYKIKQGNVCEKLKDYEILSCSTSSLVSGTKYRGEFEEKVEELCDILKKNKKFILFLDEMHTVMNAGGAEGAINMANILKPYLARGDIKVIGCTTTKESSFIKNDGAYDRRFTKIIVEENSENETLKILEKSLPKFNKFYGITADEKLMGNIITESKKLKGKFPDKAIDLLENVFTDTIWNGDIKFNKKDIQRVSEILEDRQKEFA